MRRIKYYSRYQLPFRTVAQADDVENIDDVHLSPSSSSLACFTA